MVTLNSRPAAASQPIGDPLRAKREAATPGTGVGAQIAPARRPWRTPRPDRLKYPHPEAATAPARSGAVAATSIGTPGNPAANRRETVGNSSLPAAKAPPRGDAFPEGEGP